MSLVAHHLHPATGPHALFAHARRYLGAIAHRAGRPCRVDPDDLFQEMAVLLLTNAGTYDPTRGRPESFAAVQLRPALARLRHTRSVPTEQGGPDDDRVGRAAGAEPEPAEVVADGEQVARLREAVDQLPDREWQAITLRFGLGDAESLNWDVLGDLLARLRAVLTDGPGARAVVCGRAERVRPMGWEVRQMPVDGPAGRRARRSRRRRRTRAPTTAPAAGTARGSASGPASAAPAWWRPDDGGWPG